MNLMCCPNSLNVGMPRTKNVVNPKKIRSTSALHAPVDATSYPSSSIQVQALEDSF